MSKFKLFIPITKVDVEKRLVYGRITEEKLDKSKEIMDYGLSKPNFEAWSDGFNKATDGQSVGNLRVMHGSKVAGKFTKIGFNDDDKTVEGIAKVVDEDEWQKCLEGCYTGFSVGGSYGKRIKENGGVTRYEAKPSEVSLVDNPCVHGATFELLRAEGLNPELCKFAKELPEGETVNLLEVEEDEMEKTEAKARELCKAAGFDPEERLNPNATEDDPVLKWHGFVEDAKRDLSAPGSVDVNPGVMQKWLASDGKSFDSKAEAVAHNQTLKVQKKVDSIMAPASEAMKQLNDALNKKEGKVEEETTLSDEDREKLKKATGLDDNGVTSFVATADKEVVDLILKRDFSDKSRDKLADDGKAMKDGSFPIVNKGDLHNAIMALGRAKDKTAAKAHIVTRAKALGATDELPDGWDGSTAKKGVVVEALRKGIYEVSRLANLVQELKWLQDSVRFEAEMEGDNSPVPAEMMTSVAKLGQVLIDMCEEEVGEMVTMGLKGSNVSAMEDVLAASYSPRGIDALVKTILVGDQFEELRGGLAKAATRHDEKTMKHIQKAHNSVADAMGGNCADMSKVAPRDAVRLQKAHDALKECGADCDDMSKSFTEEVGDDETSDLLSKAEGVALRKEVSNLTTLLTKAVDRINHLEAQPVEPKGVRRITKNMDNGGEDAGAGDGLDPVDSLAKVLDKVPEGERAMLMMKAAMRNPRVLAS